MTSIARLRVASLLPLLTGLSLNACSDSQPDDAGAAAAFGGVTPVAGAGGASATDVPPGDVPPGEVPVSTGGAGTGEGNPVTGPIDPGTGGTGSSAPAAGEGDPLATGYPENTGADCEVTAGQPAANTNLPDPFAMNDGTRISTKAQWACRRAEIIKDLAEFEIGPKPEPPQVAATLANNTLSVVVTTAAGSITLSSPVTPGGQCVAIGMNGNSGLINGCTQVPFMHDQVIAYAGGTGSQSQADAFYTVYPELFGSIGNYAAWSWGISRLIDGLEQVKEELNIDPSKVGVHGCSYAGKMALFAGALDERVALTVVQESGGGGINSWRTSQDFTTRTTTNIEKIDNTNYAWFKASMRGLDPYSLPHDHHELIALIAPRAVIALGNRDFEWLGDESGFKSINAAMEVWKAFGVENNVGYDFTTGHNHCAAPAIQAASVNSYVDKFLKGVEADTAIRIDPPANGFDLDVTNKVDWETPTLE